MRRTLLFVIFSAAFAGSVHAQTATLLGQRVRIEASLASGHFTVLDDAGDALLLRADTGSAPVLVPWSSIKRIDRQEMRSVIGGALRGGGIGFLIGGAAGAVVGYASGDDRCPQGWCFFAYSAEEKAGMLGIVGGVAGAAVGGLIGMRSPGKRWIPVGAGAGAGFGVAPSGGLQVGYALTW